MTINLTCACGAHVEMEDARGMFIHNGGKPDERGRVFQLEVIADRWLNEHSAHAVLCGNKEVGQ